MQTATGTSQKESNDVDDDNDGKVLNVEAYGGQATAECPHPRHS